MTILYIEQDQNKVDWWRDLRKKSYPVYQEEKDKMADFLLDQFSQSETLFQNKDQIHPVLTLSPASYERYGSKYPWHKIL
ncbi:MAG: hypothetical protein MJB14_00455 [Spirochaetes bacterium]|nr:hypothetical protein [Spirochaetota bacterium]